MTIAISTCLGAVVTAIIYLLGTMPMEDIFGKQTFNQNSNCQYHLYGSEKKPNSNDLISEIKSIKLRQKLCQPIVPSHL